jgi:hypothetical protein
MYKSIINSSIITILVLSIYACNSSDTKKNDRIVIIKSVKVQTIEVIENDSMKSIIIIKDGKVENIDKYKNGKLNGEQLKFYDNGLLSKKINTSNGITEGHKYEFYPSGSILSYNYYCQIYPCYFGVEYWDSPLNTLKKSIHYGKRGEIEKVKLFDTLGYFIKDSVPY